MVSGFCFELEWLHSLCYGTWKRKWNCRCFCSIGKKMKSRFTEIFRLGWFCYFAIDLDLFRSFKKYLAWFFFSWNMLTLAIYLFSDTPTGVVLWYLFRFRNYRQIVHQSRKSDWFCGSYGFDVFFLPLNAYRSIWPFISSYLESSKSDNSD